MKDLLSFLGITTAVSVALFGLHGPAKGGGQQGVTQVICDGSACGGTGGAPFLYRIKPNGNTISRVEVGVEDGTLANYQNLNAAQWSMTIVSIARPHDEQPTCHGEVTSSAGTCPFVLRFDRSPSQANSQVRFSYIPELFDYHDVNWKTSDGEQSDWEFPVGNHGPVHSPRPVPPNVLLIVLDDFGIENLSCYQYNPGALGCCSRPPIPESLPPGSPPTCAAPDDDPPGICFDPPPGDPTLVTPKLNELAQNGVMFRRAYSYPVCESTRAAILTGRHGFRTGVGQVVGQYALPLCEKTIPEMLKEGSQAGYRCAAFGKWDNGGGDELHPIRQGFDYYAGAQSVGDHFNWTRIVAENVMGVPVKTQTTTLTDTFRAPVIREDAVEWINSGPGPFFAYVAFDLPHGPYQVPPLDTVSPTTQALINSYNYVPGQTFNVDNDPEGARRAYEWMAEALDHEIYELLAGLGCKLANTTILIVGDNGTPGRLLQAPYVNGGGDEGGHGKGTLYEQGIRVPLIVCGARVPGPGIHEGVVSIVDLWRTIADLAGATPSPGDGTDSESLYGLLQDPMGSLARTAVFSQSFKDSGTLTDGCSPQSGCPDNNFRAMISTEFKYVRGVFNNAACAEAVVLEGAFQLTQNLVPVDPAECQNLLCPQLWSGLSAQDQQAISDLMQFPPGSE